MSAESIPPAWVDLVEHLRGTCLSLHQGLQNQGLDEGLENDKRFCEYLDSEIMVCETCGWWAETHESDDDGNCEDCQDGEEDEEG